MSYFNKRLFGLRCGYGVCCLDNRIFGLGCGCLMFWVLLVLCILLRKSFAFPPFDWGI